MQWGTRHIAIEHVCMESKAYKTCEGWGQPRNGIQLFLQMQQEGMSPNKFIFVQVIKACTGLGALEDSRLVHEQLIQVGASLMSL